MTADNIFKGACSKVVGKTSPIDGTLVRRLHDFNNICMCIYTYKTKICAQVGWLQVKTGRSANENMYFTQNFYKCLSAFGKRILVFAQRVHERWIGEHNTGKCTGACNRLVFGTTPACAHQVFRNDTSVFVLSMWKLWYFFVYIHTRPERIHIALSVLMHGHAMANKSLEHTKFTKGLRQTHI